MTIPTSLLFYQDLSPSAKAVARSRVVAFEEEQYKNSVAGMKICRSASSINALVNDHNHIRRLVHNLQAVRKYQQASQQVIERLIQENLCMFSAAGHYYSFIQKTFY